MKNFISAFLISGLCLYAQPQIPVLDKYANDLTNTLNNSELYTLNSSLERFDESTSNQIVFLMISTLDGYPLESYTYEVASRNKIGSAKNNNGVLFFVAKDDRKMRIEVGYGLEGVLPDALSSSILRNEVRPYFKHGDYYSGISVGLNAIMLAAKGEYTNNKKDTKKGLGFPFSIIVMLIIFFIIAKRGGRGGGGIGTWLLLSSLGGINRGRSSWGGGGGFGGGFGGFSGGGGSFGGGGASGSW